MNIVCGSIGLTVAIVEDYFTPSVISVKEDIIGTWTVADDGSENWCQITFYSNNTYSMRYGNPIFGEWVDDKFEGTYKVEKRRYAHNGKEYIAVIANCMNLDFIALDYNRKLFYWADKYWGKAKKNK
ncbi:hypothetical protein [Bacteroides sp. 51]|uniref:hypothetical protein n=1 Tax=Bacteroides sp. 51 TaxID=2302938 RepID=UPI0013D3C8D9|nr:hypothetical protein [Bacteroides sp. 51]NDV83955.1 hypothetical protein [Bacteroides sp. 51]